MSQLKITRVNITIRGNVEDSHNVLGFAEVIIEDGLVIKNIKILKGKNSKRKILTFPSQVTKESKKRYDICYPINKETREYFEKVIFNAYDKLVEAQPE
jgi:DNA-binding cell septation regulator SpoVG